MTYLEITRKLEKSKVTFIGICQSNRRATPTVSDSKQNELTYSYGCGCF